MSTGFYRVTPAKLPPSIFYGYSHELFIACIVLLDKLLRSDFYTLTRLFGWNKIKQCINVCAVQ